MLIEISTTKQSSSSNGLLLRDVLPSETSLNQEWALVEVQGAIEFAEGSSLDGLKMGNVHFETIDNKLIPVLVVGRHKLKGKRVPLKEPLGVLRQEIGDGNREIQVVCVLRFKYLFSERPVPILSEQNVGLVGLAKTTR
ncbi:UNVERIFIED_CONTAM: hypothetical protein HDU68_002555 [Siphonaria sp. JEL0065]|nr:hypothetical protein HDU68_002555 [Siphonaria sp. JEL0065]